MNQNEAIEFLRDKNQNDERRENLCLKCGRCCKVALPSSPQDELKRKADEGDLEATSFLNVFEPYESLDAAKKADEDYVNLIIENIKNNEGFDESKLIFYKCKHLADNNACQIYETRPDCCRRCPENGWFILPAECGFQGWQFEQREHNKKVIRGLKELLYELSFYKEEEVVTSDGQTAKELINKIEAKIEPWRKYGADLW